MTMNNPAAMSAALLGCLWLVLWLRSLLSRSCVRCGHLRTVEIQPNVRRCVRCGWVSWQEGGD